MPIPKSRSLLLCAGILAALVAVELLGLPGGGRARPVQRSLAAAAEPRAAAAEPAAPGDTRQARNVAILVHEGVELLDFAGPGEVFAAAGRHRAFNVYTVAATKDPVVSQRFLTIRPQYTLADCPPPDIIVLPGGDTNVPLEDERVIAWVERSQEDAEVVLSVCTGAFILAKCGLLDGQGATTHWGSIDALREAAPKATVHADRRYVDNGHVVTCAGVSAGIDGALHVVGRLLGEQAARDTARYMEYRWEPEAEAATAGVLHYRGDAGRTGVYDLPALREEPTVKWRVRPGAEILGTPLVADGVLYTGGDNGTLYALDAHTGETLWAAEGFEAIENATVVAGERIVAGGFSGHVRCLERRTGEEAWSFPAGAFVFAAPLVAGGEVFIATYEKLHALDLASGEPKWSAKLRSGPAFVNSPALVDGTIFVAVGPELFAFDAASGEERWRVQSKTQFWGLAAARGAVYVGNSDGHLHAYDQATGEELWKFKSAYPGQDDIWSAPGVAGDRVFAGSRDGALYAVDVRTGRQIWTFQTDGDAVGEPILSDGVLYFSDSNHLLPAGTRRLHALDQANGAQLWRFETSSTLLLTPALGEGSIYATIAGEVLALE